MSRVLGWVCAALFAVVAAMVPGTAVASAGGGVPAEFRPSSTSWIDDDRGFVLGFAPCAAGRCAALLQTVDGGTTWRTLRAPAIALTTVDHRARVHFATDLDGLITDGQSLFATHTGGRSWRPVHLPGAIGALASNDIALYAIVSDNTGTRLFSSPRPITRWAAVPGVHLPGRGAAGTITARGTTAQVALNVIHESIAYWTTTTGHTWHPAAPPCAAGANPELSRTGSTVFALCSYDPGRGFMFKDVLRSTAGAPFTLVSQAPEPGLTTTFAAASPSTVTIAAIGAGAAFLHHGTSGGTTWTTPLLIDELPFADLAFTSHHTGTVLWGGPLWSDARIYRTDDAGATWTPLTFT